MNPIQKYPQIIELSACILNMFVLVFLCPANLVRKASCLSGVLDVDKDGPRSCHN